MAKTKMWSPARMESSRKRPTFVLFVAICIFGMSTWIGITGLWILVPKFVHILPEKWHLPSSLIAAIQLSKIAPFIYLAIQKCRPDLVKEWVAACSLICFGLVTSLTLIFCWDMTAYVAGHEISIALLFLVLCISMVDSISSVVFLPYVSKFKSSIFVTALYFGEGLSNLIPGFIGLIQTGINLQSHSHSFVNSTSINNTSADNKPDTSSITFNLVAISIFMAASLVSFLFIHFHPYFDVLKTSSDNKGSRMIISNFDDDKTETNVYVQDVEKHAEVFENEEDIFEEVYNSEYSNIQINNTALQASVTKKLSRVDLCRCILCYILVAWISSLFFSVIPSIQSYSCLPYGTLTYDLTVKLAIIMNPIGSILTLFVKTRRLSIISIIATIGSLMTAYHFYLAILSPDPILKDEIVGNILAILSGILITLSFAYARTCIGIVLTEFGKKNLLLLIGVFLQLGSVAGAAVSYLLVNVLQIFKQ